MYAGNHLSAADLGPYGFAGSLLGGLRNADRELPPPLIYNVPICKRGLVILCEVLGELLSHRSQGQKGPLWSSGLASWLTQARECPPQ